MQFGDRYSLEDPPVKGNTDCQGHPAGRSALPGIGQLLAVDYRQIPWRTNRANSLGLLLAGARRRAVLVALETSWKSAHSALPRSLRVVQVGVALSDITRPMSASSISCPTMMCASAKMA